MLPLFTDGEIEAQNKDEPHPGHQAGREQTRMQQGKYKAPRPAQDMN